MAEQVAEQTRLVRTRMSYDDYLALPHGVRAEYVDGEVVVSPPASWVHNGAQRRLANTIEAALPVGFCVITESGYRRGRVSRVPDIAVYAEREPDETVFTEQVPVLVCEVLSPTTRGEDTIRKSGEYAAAGIGQYWLLDPRHRTLTVLSNRDGAWDFLLELDAAQPTGEASVAGHATIAVDLDVLLTT